MTDVDRAASERAAARIREIVVPVHASHGLRAAIAQDRLAAAPARRPRRRLIAVAAAAGLASAVIALVLAGPAVTPGGGSVADAAQVALRAPTAPAPARGTAGYLRQQVDGVVFPDYTRQHGWRAIGTRRDRIGSHTAVTVVYARGTQRVGYTIVSGRALAVPGGARRVRYEGLDVAVLRRGDARYITWTRGGRTCVLATRDAGLARLLAFASAR